MGAGRFTDQAEGERGMQRGAKKRKTLATHNTCSCHPRQYGLKKGLRRARRRVAKRIIARELRDEQ